MSQPRVLTAVPDRGDTPTFAIPSLSRLLGHEDSVRMVPQVATVEGRRLRYALSTNAPAAAFDGPVPGAFRPGASRPAPDSGIWVLNIHGYFAGGGMYWRESARLAAGLGHWVVNPSVPGFGGSDPLPWEQTTMAGLARRMIGLMDHLGIERALLVGHSMGGAIAMKIAADHPDRVLGIVYRDGAATPSWRTRRGPVSLLLSPVAPDLAGLADLLAAAVLDIPDIVAGRLASTVRSAYPDLRRNVRAIGRTIPVAALLFSSDLSGEVETVRRHGAVPVLPEWGTLDRITPPRTAEEFSQIMGEEILWLPGGHSWMLARPASQLWVLRYHDRGLAFMDAVRARSAHLAREAMHVHVAGRTGSASAGDTDEEPRARISALRA